MIVAMKRDLMACYIEIVDISPPQDSLRFCVTDLFTGVLSLLGIN